MNNKVNYTAVGFIVLFGIALMIAFSYWLMKPSDEEATSKYLVYFDESVLGLNIDAPVKYRGISVGKVVRVRVNPKNSEQVEVLVSILSTTPVKSNTVAQLTAQGITGLSYINLSLGDNHAPALLKEEGYNYPVIKSIPSFFENFEKSLGSISSQLSTTLTGTEKLLNDKNQEQIRLLLQRSAGFMDKMEKLLDDKTIQNLQTSVENLALITEKVDKVIPNIHTLVEKSISWEESVSTSLGSIMKSYLSVQAAMDEIKKAASSGQFNLKDISSDVLPTLNDTLMQMQDTMIKIEDSLYKYERSPGDILFKYEEIKKGPGER
ncbi:MAG: MlaD family protein [Sulfurimonas sp.]|nr:MlaD family protein [Sulfurimonas sp.]MDD5203558.1 MlaD family protein [Sulfurimonas sp.]